MATVVEVVLKLREEVAAGATKSASSLDKVDASAKRAQSSLSRAGSLSGVAGSSLGRLENVANKGGQSLMKLAGGLDLLIPGAGGAARAVGDFADIAEIGAGAASGMGLTVASLGPIVLAAAAAFGIYKLVMNDVNARMQVLKDRAEAAGEATKSLSGLVDDVVAAERAAELAKMPEHLRAVTEGEDKWGDKLRATNALLEEQLRLTPTGNTSVATDLGAFAPFADKFVLPERATGEAADVVGTILETEDAAKRGAKADLDAAAAKRAHADAEKALQVEMTTRKSLTDSLIAAQVSQITAEQAAQKELGAIWQAALASVMTPMDKANAAIDEQIRGVQLLIDKFPELGTEGARAIDALNLSRAVPITIAGPSFSAPGTVNPSTADSAAGVLGAAGGGMAGLAQMVPVWGQAIAAGIGLVMGDSLETLSKDIIVFGDKLSELGPKLTDSMTSFAEKGLPNLIAGVGDFVGDVFLKVIPKYLELIYSPETWAKVVEAIAMAVASILGDAFRVVGKLFQADTWKQLGKWILEGLFGDGNDKNGTGPLNLFGSEGGFVDFAENVAGAFTGERPEFATGTDHVARTGMALVHAGEAIVPTSGVASQGTRSKMRGGGGDTHLHFSGFAVGTTSDFVRELNRQMGSGRRRIALNAGAVGA